LTRILLFALLLAVGASCAALQKKADPEPTTKARDMLRAGNFVEALLMRRFTDGRLLVRLQDGGVFFLDPKQTCPWCWIYVDRRVYVDINEHTAVLVSPKGERIECWNGGQMEKF
jgi:hypothetical protein